MVKTERKLIDGVEVVCTQLPGWRATMLFHKLLAAVGPAVTQLEGLDGTQGGLLGLDLGKLRGPVETLLAGLPEAKFKAIIEELFAGCLVKAPSEGIASETDLLLVFDTLFAGNVLLLFRILWFALGVNFGSFTVAAARLKAARLASQSNSTTS